MKHEQVDGEFGADTESSGVPWKLILLLVVVVALAIFFFQNGDDVAVNFLTFEFTWPLWAVIGVSVVLGIVLDRLGTWQWRRARARRNVE
jgi:uncharacterized integral membrane protein